MHPPRSDAWTCHTQTSYAQTGSCLRPSARQSAYAAHPADKEWPPLPAPPAFSNEVYLTCLVSVPASSGFNFSISLTNTGPNSVTVDPVAPNNTCILVIERVS